MQRRRPRSARGLRGSCGPLALGALIACGGSGGGSSGTSSSSCPAATSQPQSGYPASHAPFPQVTYQGGGLLASPEIVTVTFPGDTLAGPLQEFGDSLTRSCWWDAVRAGYCDPHGSSCVGQGTVPSTAHVELPMSPGPKYTDSIAGQSSTLQSFVQQQVAGGLLPPPDANTIYALYFPSNALIELDGQPSCRAFGGYHNTTTVTPPGGKPAAVPYVVVPRCTDQTFLSLFGSQLDEATFAASHELTEAAADPNAGLMRIGFYLPQSLDSVPWNAVGGGEVGDLCVDYVGEAQGHPTDQATAVTSSGSYTVQRIWSNAAAKAGGDPCVPAIAGDTYFNVAISEGNGTVTLPVGGSATFEADAFSTGPMSWKVVGQDLASLTGQAPVVEVSISASTVTNGDKVMVTVKLMSAPGTLRGSNVAGEPYLLISQSGTTYHLWPGVVLAN